MRKIWLVGILVISRLVPFGGLDARRSSSHRSAPHSASRSHSTRTRTMHIRTHRTRVSSAVRRSSYGRLKRSAHARSEFMRQTGYPRGRKGFVVDHIVPLACGGRDDPCNMQWQTTAEAKDKWERKSCR